MKKPPQSKAVREKVVTKKGREEILTEEEVAKSPLVAVLSAESTSLRPLKSPKTTLDTDSDVEVDELTIEGADDADDDLDELTDDLADEFVDDAFPRGLDDENDDDLTDDLSDELGTEKFFRDNDSGMEDDDEDLSRSW